MSNTTAFLNKIKGGAYSSWHKYKILPSVVAAQAALESSWGTSRLSTQGYNLFGVKGSYNGSSVVMQTQEDLGGGNMIWINASFAKYPDWNVSIAEHGKLVGQTPRYRSAVGLRDPRAQITAIWSSGYATDSAYVSKIMSVINANNLRAWDLDAFNGGDGGGFSEGGGDEFKNFRSDTIKKNAYSRPALKISGVSGVVIHDIQTSATVATVRKNLDSGNGGTKMGYHIIVSDVDAALIVPLNEGVYHAERAKIAGSLLSNANNKTISIGVLTKNAKNEYNKNLNVKLALVVAEVLRTYKLSASAILPSWEIDGVGEPLNWYNNPFQYTAFKAMAGDALEKGEAVITNPNYGSGDGNLGTDGTILNGSGAINKIISEATSLLGSMTYSWTRPAQIRKGGFGDCSSFCQFLYQKHANVDIGSYTDAQWYGGWGKRINVSEARAGDLIFFNGTYATTMTTTHIGIVIGDNKMIDFGSTPGPKTNNYRDSYWGSKVYGAKRIFSDRDYELAIGKKEPSQPTIDPRGAYAVSVKRYAPAQSQDIGGVTQKRLTPNEVYRVQEVGTASLKIGEDLWVPKVSDGIALSKLSSPTTPVGTMTTKLRSRVYTSPSLVSDRVVESGLLKEVPASLNQPIYAVQNGFAQINETGDEWAVASSSYATISIDLREENIGDVNLGQGVPTEIEVQGKYLPEDYLYIDSNLPVGKTFRSAVAHKDLLPIGAVVDIYVPSTKSSYRAVVASNLLDSENGDVVELVSSNEGLVYNFGGRKTNLTLVGHITDLSKARDFINGQEIMFEKDITRTRGIIEDGQN